MTKPKSIAVLISDIHYNLQTLPLADAAMRQAIAKSNELKVPLIVAGDLHDTKANLRAECVNAMLATFALADIQPYVMCGNHDSINEKSQEHALNFLDGLVTIVDEHLIIPDTVEGTDIELIAYHNDTDKLKLRLKKSQDAGYFRPIIMHQGIQGSNSGEYIQDRSAITKDDVKDLRVISGHYHARQDIKTGRPQKGALGLWSYIGNPYTLNFGEANDPAKGFQILHDDGTLKFVRTNLRRHIILNVEKANYDYWQITGKVPLEDVQDKDLVWVKMTGSKEDLVGMNKTKVAKILFPLSNFKLDLIPTTYNNLCKAKPIHKTKEEQLDHTIDSMADVSTDRKQSVKDLWKGMK